ncbi:MAG: hypothetical protein IT204_05010, partial [Fimbriimonadaceae bacterium]|nr:hypothetical protein [Fimbriimonadaceae bacterium]
MRWLLGLLLTVSLAAAETFVVAAGVESYDDTNITPLKCAVADAKAFAD